ncbi:MAG: hypothetical protein ACE5HP_12955 [Gemmatimonadota bacterium]
MPSVLLRELERKVEEVRGHPWRLERSASSPTGISPLDALLPEGGLPRGRVVEWLGPRSCGKTALLRAALLRWYGEGEAVAVVDAGRTLYAPDWVELAGEIPFWVIRPSRREEAAWCTDLLLRSGVFGAVALELETRAPLAAPFGEPRGKALSRNVTVRLQRLAEEEASVFVVVGELPLAALRLRFRPGRLEPLRGGPFGPVLPPMRPMWVRVERGRSCEVPILCPVPPERGVQPLARDRKGPR